MRITTAKAYTMPKEALPFWIQREKQIKGEPSFSIGQGEETVFSFTAPPIARIFSLLDLLNRGKLTLDNVNCHGSAYYVINGEQPEDWWLHPVKKQGKEISVDEALRTLQLPCGIQLADSSSVDHSGVLLGQRTSDALIAGPIVFHKNGKNPPEICRFSDMQASYSYCSEVRFYGEEKKIDPVQSAVEEVARESSSMPVGDVKLLAAVCRGLLGR